MKRKHAVGALFCVALVGFTYTSPYIAMFRISSAANPHRALELSLRVDFPALRANIGQQLAPHTPPDMLGAMVDTIVSPAGVAELIKYGAYNQRDQRGLEPPPKEKKHNFAMSYQSWNVVELRREDTDRPTGAFILRRHGFWDWKLIGITLPPQLLTDQ